VYLVDSHFVAMIVAEALQQRQPGVSLEQRARIIVACL
jgi:hypothetical protein